MHGSILTQQVNFIISIIFIGSFALLGIVTILEASGEENPIATHMATIASYESGI